MHINILVHIILYTVYIEYIPIQWDIKTKEAIK